MDTFHTFHSFERKGMVVDQQLGAIDKGVESLRISPILPIMDWRLRILLAGFFIGITAVFLLLLLGK